MRALRWQNAVWWGLPAVCFFLLTTLRWKHYGVVTVDFGQEMAAAWEITQGKHLYADIAYFKGPFSPHFNALLMMLFGISVHTIVTANAAIAFAIAYGIVALARKSCGLPISSFLACSFLIVFAFSVDSEYNNFNFITPFVHELTHGLGLSLMMLLAMERWQRTKGTRSAITAGISFGLVWLTRIEVSVALTATCAVWMWCSARQGTSWKSLVKGAVVVLLSATLVLLLACVALAQTLPWDLALRSTFATLDALLHTPVISSPFFLRVGGWNHPWAAFCLQIVILLVVSSWILFFYAAADLWSKGDRLMGTVFAIGGLGIVLILSPRLLPFAHGAFLTVFILCLVGYALQRVWRCTTRISEQEKMVIVIGVFSLGMLGKIFFFPSILFYGFVHALPAYLLLLGVMLTATPPYVMHRLGEQGKNVFLILLVCSIMLDVGGKARIDQVFSNRKTLSIGVGSDLFFVSDIPMNRFYRAFLDKAPTLIPMGSTFTAIPEGAMANYLLRLPLGVPTLNMMRTEYFIFGKKRIEGELFARRPDFILITHKETSNFGIPLYGKMPEYGAEVMVWLKREYEQIALFGEQPLTSPTSEGVALWRRRDYAYPKNAQDVPSLR